MSSIRWKIHRSLCTSARELGYLLMEVSMSLHNLARNNLGSRYHPKFEFPRFKPNFSEGGRQWPVRILGVGHTRSGVLVAEVVDLDTGDCLLWIEPHRRILRQIIQVWQSCGQPDDVDIVLEYRRESYCPVPILHASALR